MNNAAPENTAALQEKIAELEQQLKLSDEGASHLAERCLSLEQKVQSYLAAHPQREMHTDSPTLLQPLLYYDAGFGFSEKDTLTAPDCTTDELTGAVTATFELPVAVQALRFDPGELPCCITNLIFSDDRIICVPTNGLNLSGGSTLFLGDDPNYRLEGTTHYPAGMKLVVSYGYFPLETLTDEPLFCAVLQGVQQLQLRKDSENSISSSWSRMPRPSSRWWPPCSRRSHSCTRKTPICRPGALPTRPRWKACFPVKAGSSLLPSAA